MRSFIGAFRILFACSVICVYATSFAQHLPTSNAYAGSPNPDAQNSLKAKASCFIENKGQWEAKVKYLLRSGVLDMWITDNGIVYDLHESHRLPDSHDRSGADVPDAVRKGHVIAMSFEGSFVSPTFESQHEIGGTTNYLIGSDASKWVTGVKSYSDVTIKSLYRNIDAVFYLEDGRPRYDIVLNPGADPSKIKLSFTGQDGIERNSADAITLKTSLGNIDQRNLFAYQIIDGKKQQVACAFRVTDNGDVGFNIGEYSKASALIIDPLVYSTYLGGTGSDEAWGIAVDKSHNAYITGFTNSTSLPATTGAYQTTLKGSSDAFVTKFAADGKSVVYTTYLGSSASSVVTGRGIAVDTAGHAFVTGRSTGANFPTTTGAFQASSFNGSWDCYVTKFAADGKSLIYSTLLTANSTTVGDAIAVDLAGYAYVGGHTSSTNYPTTTGAFQSVNAGIYVGFITKVATDGKSLIYSTLLGGTADDRVNGIAVDGAGYAFVAGAASSTDHPTTTGAVQTVNRTSRGAATGFLAKIATDGKSLIYSTLIGGTVQEVATSVALDSTDHAYITGLTYSSNFPTTTGAYQTSNNATPSGTTTTVFVSKFAVDGKSLVYSTYLGGTSQDAGYGIAVDSGNQAHVTGQIYSTNFPTTVGAYQVSSGGGFDAFVTKLAADGKSLVYSSYFGGALEEYGHAIALDNTGAVYIAGRTASTSGIATAGAYQTSNAGGSYDAFATNFGIVNSASISLTSPVGTETWCAGSTKSITYTSTGITNVKIEVSTDGGSTFPTTLTSTAGTSSYSWAVPTNSTAGTQYRIRVSDASNATTKSVSPANFTMNAQAAMSIAVSSPILWPPNASSITETVTPTVTGGCSPTYTLTSITSSETLAAGDVQNATTGTADLSFDLRKTRLDFGQGRVYTITYQLSDVSGNQTVTAKVLAPRNLGTATATSSGTNIPLPTQNTPNPAVSSTTIGYSLPSAGVVTLRIYNGLGKTVRTLVNGVSQSAGANSAVWDLKNSSGVRVPSGTYFYQVSTATGISQPVVMTVN